MGDGPKDSCMVRMFAYKISTQHMQICRPEKAFKDVIPTPG